MKKLELNQMKNLEGGGKGRDCALKGALLGFVVGVTVITGGGFWLASGAGASTLSGMTDCLEL